MKITAKKQAEIELEPVESSNIEGVGYDPATKTLRIQFRGGCTYDYANVPAEKHKALIDAESVGKHFHQHIRNKHKFLKVA